MAIKMILLKTGETIITDAKEVVQEEVTRGYLLTQPQIVEAHDKTFLTEESGANSNYEVDVVLKYESTPRATGGRAATTKTGKQPSTAQVVPLSV